MNKEDLQKIDKTVERKNLASKDFFMVKEQLDSKDFKQFEDLLIKTLTQFNINLGDPRVTFNLAEYGPVFIVGQRYCLQILVKKRPYKFAIISDEIRSEKHFVFQDKHNTRIYNFLSNLNLNGSDYQTYLSIIEQGLKRTRNSSFRKYNIPDFENYIFEQKEHKFNVISTPKDEFKVPQKNYNAEHFPKNLILYGPPGTGKTYSTNKKAREIAESNERIFFVTFHQSFSYEQFVEGLSVNTSNNGDIIYKIKDGIFKIICDKAIKNPYNNYVLIIDEINRGNVSNIFGELITLLEEDKRIGSPNEINITLPYSCEEFAVPSNLYIIGTMNTADRSLVQLDSALRRRFDFEEIMPNYNLLSDNIIGFNIKQFLQKLNDKISENYDRDHQIGHSYLMNIENLEGLKRAWENRIMPLLQEYFYFDFEKLSNIIGKSEYISKNGDTWIIQMQVTNFENNFRKIYDNIIGQDITNKLE